jgi:hypothetical protein
MNRFQTLLSISTCAATVRGKVRRYKAPNMADRVQNVYSFFVEHGFDSTTGVHLFTEKTAMVGRCRLTLSRSVLKAPLVSALETKI